MDTYATSGTGQTDIGNDAFQQLTFGIANLTSGLHEITITNKGFSNGTSAYFDVDYVVWESSLPDQWNAQIFTTLANGTFEYLPTNASWGSGADPKSYSKWSYWTEVNDAKLRLNFTGQSIALYGSVDTNHGNFTCSIDGISRGSVSGTYPSQIEQQLLCFGDNLNNHKHVLVVENQPVSTGKVWLDIDYACVYGSHPCVDSNPFVIL